MEHADFLLEIGTEELPPRSLQALSQALSRNLEAGLIESRLKFTSLRAFASPRRLAVYVAELARHQSTQQVEKRGPSVSVAFDENGRPTKAAVGFARSCGVTVDELERLSTDKGEWLVYRSTDPGGPAPQLLPELVASATAALPIAKRMRWGCSEAAFVRPVHWLVALHGSDIVPMELFGIEAGRSTRGHRFHHPQAIRLRQARDYERTLADTGHVIADFKRRQSLIREQVETCARNLGGRVRMDPALLEEVTALVEWPVALSGHFERRFLSLPDEVLIATLEGHQRYFPVHDNDGALLPAFITVANIESRDPETVRHGNERVVRPRLADALFFWEQDRRRPLSELAAELSRVLFQKGLGTLADKTARLQALARRIAEPAGARPEIAAHAAALAKADLLTDMVGEFPELQGVMGRHYALASGEQPEVASALEEQYLPRYAGDRLPETPSGRTLALADRLDTLCGIFALGRKPTGEKDPFALRRAALGVLRILIEGEVDLDLAPLVARGLESQPISAADSVSDDLLEFFLERLRAYYAGQPVTVEVFNSVASVQSTRPLDFQRRLDAVKHFLTLPESQRLAAAHKRVRNILRQAGQKVNAEVSPALFQDTQEKRLHTALLQLEAKHAELMQTADYGAALVALAEIDGPINDFFDSVMVMAEDASLRANRLSLLERLNALCCSVVDISCLPG